MTQKRGKWKSCNYGAYDAWHVQISVSVPNISVERFSGGKLLWRAIAWCDPGELLPVCAFHTDLQVDESRTWFSRRQLWRCTRPQFTLLAKIIWCPGRWRENTILEWLPRKVRRVPDQTDQGQDSYQRGLEGSHFMQGLSCHSALSSNINRRRRRFHC